MAEKNTAAFGIYSDRVQVEQGIDSLRAARFRNEDISGLFADKEGTKDFAHQRNTKAAEGATAGAGAGGDIGGTLGSPGWNWGTGYSGSPPLYRGETKSWQRWPVWV